MRADISSQCSSKAACSALDWTTQPHVNQHQPVIISQSTHLPCRKVFPLLAFLSGTA